MRVFIQLTLTLASWLLVCGISTADDWAAKIAAKSSLELPPDNLPELIKDLRTSGCGMPASAAELVKIGKPAVASLVELLEDSRWIPRWKAARVLGLIGPDAKDALPALEKALQRKDQHALERQFIPLSIAAIKSDTKTLNDCVAGKDIHPEPARIFAAELLGNMGPKGKDAVPVLQALANSLSAERRSVIIQALEKIDHDAASQLQPEPDASQRPQTREP